VSAIPANDLPAPPPGPAMWCSECRAAMRTQYFALNERPICAKCRPQYAKMIQRGTGPAAMQRAVIHGLVTTLVGAAALAAGVIVFPFIRLPVVVGIGWFMGKRIMASVDGYGGRRYQYLAVGLTYLAISIGSIVPAIKRAHDDAKRQAAIEAAQIRTLATEHQAINEELEALGIEPIRTRPQEEKAGVGSFVVAFFTLPILAMFEYGIYVAAVGLFAIGFALYKAWDFTDGQGLDLQLRGPFRVGTGPITATF
jgi:hypothetical protein